MGPEAEKKLLEILSQPEIERSAGDSESKESSQIEQEIKSAFPHLTPRAQKIMAKTMLAEMPTPEEIAQAERCAQHNAEVAKLRAERLAQRAMRREAGISPKKRRKRKRRR